MTNFEKLQKEIVSLLQKYEDENNEILGCFLNTNDEFDGDEYIEFDGEKFSSEKYKLIKDKTKIQAPIA